MQRVFAILISLAIAAGGVLALPEQAPARPKASTVPGQYIVTLKKNVNPAGKAKGLAQSQGIGVLHVYSHAMNGFAATVPDARLAKLRNDPDVVSIVEDRVVTLPEPMERDGAGLERSKPRKASTKPGSSTVGSQSMPTGILRIGGNLSSTKSGDGAGAVNVDVAVIDTGSGPHQDLNIVGGKNCQSGKNYNDGNGHGTHVAGTIGARDNTSGVVGVAPGARIWSVRVLDNNGSGTWSSVLCGIDWVTQNASVIEVANMSLGGDGGEGSCNDGGLRQGICGSVAKGVTYAVAAGNSAKDAQTFVPATFDEVITVSALADFNGRPFGGAAATCRADVDDTFADFSNYGVDVDIAAPGVCILSTWASTSVKNGFRTISGTSMASPHVAGAAALYKAANPSASPEQVKAALITGWEPGPIPGDPDGYKEGVLNVKGL
jgi:subtilisin